MIQSREQVVGYNFIAGQGSDQATFVLKLKPFEERTGGFFYKLAGLWEGDGIMRFFIDVRSSNMILGTIYKQISSIKGAQIIAFGAPMIPGYGLANSVTFTMQDKTGGSLDHFFKVTQDYLKELNQRPEIHERHDHLQPQLPTIFSRCGCGQV
jgi:acrB/acrD family multidrug resistance protein